MRITNNVSFESSLFVLVTAVVCLTDGRSKSGKWRAESHATQGRRPRSWFSELRNQVNSFAEDERRFIWTTEDILVQRNVLPSDFSNSMVHVLRLCPLTVHGLELNLLEAEHHPNWAPSTEEAMQRNICSFSGRIPDTIWAMSNVSPPRMISTLGRSTANRGSEKGPITWGTYRIIYRWCFKKFLEVTRPSLWQLR